MSSRCLVASLAVREVRGESVARRQATDQGAGPAGRCTGQRQEEPLKTPLPAMRFSHGREVPQTEHALV